MKTSSSLPALSEDLVNQKALIAQEETKIIKLISSAKKRLKPDSFAELKKRILVSFEHD